MLLKANIKDEVFNGKTVHRGEVITSLQILAEELGMSVQNVRTGIKHLKDTGELRVKITPNYSLITVVNYSKYQDAIFVQPVKPRKPKADPQEKPKRKARTKAQQQKVDTEQERIVPEDYRPKEWETNIPQRFWGRFDSLEKWKEWAK